MKTERRHELQTNWLADQLGTKTKQIRPYIKLIVGVLVLSVAAIVLLSIGSVQRNKARELAWKDLFALQVNANNSFDPLTRSDYAGQLVDLSKKHAGSPVGAWAMQSAGDINLALGSDLLWRDRDDARAKFNLALENYNGALSASDHDMLRQRALQGVAQANEALNQPAEAEGTYQQIIDKWPDTAVAKTAAKRLAFLQRPSTGEFYDWFVRQEPVPPPLTSGIPGQSLLDELPNSPGLSLPNADDLTRPGGTPSDGTLTPFSVVAPESSTQPPESSTQITDDESSSAEVGRGGDFEITPTEPSDEATPAEGNGETADPPGSDNDE